MDSRYLVLITCLILFYKCENVFAKNCRSCVLLRHCPKAFETLQKLNNETIERFKKSHCGNQLVDSKILPKICCSDFDVGITVRINNEKEPETLKPTETKSEENIESHKNFNLLPETCGNIDGNRIIGGEVAKLYEFPWMALISYTKGVFGGRKKVEFQCGGSIIHPRYILTAAHCVKNKDIAGVRVGDYNINTKEDCQGEGPFYVCENYIQDVGVKEFIVHENYSTFPFTQNDIALLRLKKAIDVSRKNIKPVCLPIYNELKNKDIAGMRATVAGWGVTELNLVPEALRKVVIEIKKDSKCREYYEKSYTRSLDVMDKKFCAGDEGKDSCRGDSGGPLMIEDEYRDKDRMIQFGIVSFGPQQCGSTIPGVYTDVRKYINWILDNIRE